MQYRKYGYLFQLYQNTLGTLQYIYNTLYKNMKLQKKNSVFKQFWLLGGEAEHELARTCTLRALFWMNTRSLVKLAADIHNSLLCFLTFFAGGFKKKKHYTNLYTFISKDCCPVIKSNRPLPKHGSWNWKNKH